MQTERPLRSLDLPIDLARTTKSLPQAVRVKSPQITWINTRSTIKTNWTRKSLLIENLKLFAWGTLKMRHLGNYAIHRFLTQS